MVLDFLRRYLNRFALLVAVTKFATKLQHRWAQAHIVYAKHNYIIVKLHLQHLYNKLIKSYKKKAETAGKTHLNLPS